MVLQKVPCPRHGEKAELNTGPSKSFSSGIIYSVLIQTPSESLSLRDTGLSAVSAASGRTGCPMEQALGATFLWEDGEGCMIGGTLGLSLWVHR